MNITLYQANELARLESHIDEDGVIDMLAYDAAQITLADKQFAVVAYIKNSELTEGMLDVAIKELTAKKKAIAARNASLKAYLAANMKEHGITSIKANDGTFQATLYTDRDESVVILDGATFPPELCNAPKPPEPSKTLIKAAINAGQAVAGAVIVRNDRLTIK
jgi:predicted nucleic acid-binding protein